MENVAAGHRPVKYYIYRTKMTVNGTTIYAKDYGLKAFRIPIYG